MGYYMRAYLQYQLYTSAYVYAGQWAYFAPLIKEIWTKTITCHSNTLHSARLVIQRDVTPILLNYFPLIYNYILLVKTYFIYINIINFKQ